MKGASRMVEREELEQLRQNNIGRLCLRLFRAFNGQAVGILRAHGHTGITLSHTALLINLDTDGSRIVDLADRAGMSKQAMGRLVQDLEGAGYVRGAVDPTDRRATIVTFTDRGRQFLQDAVYIQRQIEANYATAIGEEHLTALREWMLMLVHHAEIDAEAT